MAPTPASWNKTGVCFSCERYIGAAESCPYCGVDPPWQPARRALRWAALGLALTGLIWLHVSARGQDSPHIEISRVTPVMNFARVRIAGTVQRRAYRTPREGVPEYISFVVDDETGSIRVQAWGEVAAALADTDRLPSAGDRVKVTGRIRISAQGDPRLALDTADDVLFKHEADP